MDRKDMQAKMRAAYALLLEDSTTREKFESIRTLIKGVNPRLDASLEEASQAMADYEKLHRGEFIELSAEKLPEETEEQKKRKKALLFLIRSWKQVQSEVERVQAEFEKSEQSGDKPQDTLSRILRGAKGPLGIVTICALVIVAGLTVFSKQPSQQSSQQEVSAQPIPSENKQSIRVIEFNGKYIPLSELDARSGPDCDQESHYHAKTGSAKAIDGTIIQDPGACAFGKVKDTKIIKLEGQP